MTSLTPAHPAHACIRTDVHSRTPTRRNKLTDFIDLVNWQGLANKYPTYNPTPCTVSWGDVGAHLKNEDSFSNKFVLCVIVANAIIMSCQAADNSDTYRKNLDTGTYVCILFYQLELVLKVN